MPTQPPLSERHLFVTVDPIGLSAAGHTSDAPPPDVKLVGVINGTGVTMALIQMSDDNVMRSWRGQSVDGWTLVAISSRSIVLTNGGRQQEYLLDPPVDPNSSVDLQPPE